MYVIEKTAHSYKQVIALTESTRTHIFTTYIMYNDNIYHNYNCEHKHTYIIYLKLLWPMILCLAHRPPRFQTALTWSLSKCRSPTEQRQKWPSLQGNFAPKNFSILAECWEKHPPGQRQSAKSTRWFSKIFLPETNNSPLKIGHPKKESSLPIIHFQVRSVSFREDILPTKKQHRLIFGKKRHLTAGYESVVA